MRLQGHLPHVRVSGWYNLNADTRRMSIAVVLNPRDVSEAENRFLSQGPYTREEFIDQQGMDPALRQRIIDWVTRNALRLTDQREWILWLEGSADQIQRTFNIRFYWRRKGQQWFFYPRNDPEVPGWMASWIAGIVGLDNISRLNASHRQPKRPEQLPNGGLGFFPKDLETAYHFPSTYDGTGQTIGLLEFSNGYNIHDVQDFWQRMGITPPTLKFVSVDGTPNDGGAQFYDMEATLDVEWAGAMAPGANLVVYEASAGMSDQSFGLSVLKALDYAIHDTVNHPSVLSISYGDSETHFPPAVMQAWDTVILHGAMIGITTFVASGDQGAYGLHGLGWPKLRVDTPANCPHAVAVGGTHLVLSPDGSIETETGWTDTNNNGASGGGISQVFPVPSYQSRLTLPLKIGQHAGRGLPDVAADADPDTGYFVIFQGQGSAIGGTSAAAPLWAALCARINQARTAVGLTPLGYANPVLYNLGAAISPSFRAITEGNNSYNCVSGFQCGPGWNAVTGWGSPRVSQLIDALTAKFAGGPSDETESEEN